MRFKIFFLTFLLLSIFIPGAKKVKLKGEKVIVTATKTKVESKKIGNSVTIITKEEMEKKNYRNVEEALREVPGLIVTRNGSMAGNSSVMIRGAESSGTLVLINGVEVNDPMSPSRGFNFRDILTDNIKRIEIIRGPQSTVWGSDSLGGVINIILDEGKKKRVASISGYYGSNNTYDFKAFTKGMLEDKFSYSLSIDRIDSDGFSSADVKFGNSEDDGYRNVSGIGNFSLKINENISLNGFFYSIDSRSDLDNFGGEYGDDPNYKEFLTFNVGNVGVKISQMDGKITHDISLSYFENKRDYKNPEDLMNSFSSYGRYYGNMKKGEWKTKVLLNENNLLTLGYEYKRESGYSFYEYNSSYYSMESFFPTEDAEMNSFYFEDLFSPMDEFYITGGIRVDHHSEFGNDVNVKISPVYIFNSGNTRIRMSFGTGFKAPSIYQLYAPETAFGPVGNPNLKPENSWSIDGGVENYFFNKKIMICITPFYNKFTDLIDFQYGSGYLNVGKANTKGIEISGYLDLCSQFSIDGSYTYLDTEDETTGLKLLRRPDDVFNLNFNFKPIKSINSTLNLFYKGDRWDINYNVYPAQRVKLDSYTLLNFSFSYDISKNINVFGKINNILDEKYEEVYGYGSDDTYLEMGLKFTLK